MSGPGESARCLNIYADDKNNKPLAEKTVEGLIGIIKGNGLKPGDRLPNEFDLAKMLNVGRSTLREAVKSLVSRNILVTQRGAGTFVSSLNGIPTDPLGLTFIERSDDEIALAFNEVRQVLEPEIAGLAALNATNKQKEEIMRQCELVEGLIKRRAPYYSEDMEFHRLLAQASGNVVMMQLVPILHHAIGKNIDRTNNELAGETVIWHKNIAVAVQRSDDVGARNAMFIPIELNRRMIYEKIVAGKNAAAR